MKALTPTKARAKLFRLIDESVRSHKIHWIAGRDGEAVLMSAEDYSNLLETLELLSTRGFLKGFKEARKDIAAGRTHSMEEVFGRR